MTAPKTSSYRRNLPHIQRDDRPHFITFRTARDFKLPPEARDLVIKHCLHGHGHSYELHAAVVMPNHVHLLLTPLVLNDRTITLAEIMQGIKGASAHSVNRLLMRHGSLWQDESFDHVLRSLDSVADKIDYICENPVRARLANREEDYRWLWRGSPPA